jgi:hypothetical protein
MDNHDNRHGSPYFDCLARWRLRSRIPGPPPFSSMNSMPANTNAGLGTANDIAEHGVARIYAGPLPANSNVDFCEGQFNKFTHGMERRS